MAATCSPRPASPLSGVLGAMAIRSIDDLEVLLGPGSEAVADLRRLFTLAAGYGYADWLVFDPSVVRGLAYYTGEEDEGREDGGRRGGGQL